MYEVLIGILGILIGLSAGVAAQLWIELKRVCVLKQTLENDWQLRQIEGAVKTPRGYDSYQLQTVKDLYSGSSTTGTNWSASTHKYWDVE